MHQKDDSTYEISQAKLKLNDGLSFTLQVSGDQDWYLIEDETRGKVFRVGLPEYTVLSLLNGKRTLGEAVAQTVVHLGPNSIDEQGVTRLAQWVIESGIAHSDASQSQDRITQRRQKETFQDFIGWLNPVSTRIRLFNPDSFVAMLERVIRPLTGWWIVPVWLCVVAYGMLLLAGNYEELFFQRLPSYSSFDYVWFVVAWLVLKLIHEMAHAVACKRFGGEVPQFGILLLLLIPLPFVDVTSSWRFENKYKRILTSFAGMLTELFVASIAIAVWANIDSGVLKHHLGDLIIAATLHTLLFNANPLMRFDGYYILSDWIEIPNLATRGRNEVKSFFNWMFFGTRSGSLRSAGQWVVRSYGWAALVWMVLVCASLATAAIAMFGGIGIAMVGVSLIFWIGIPLYRLLRFLAVGGATQRPNRVRFCGMASLLTVGLAAVLVWVPAPAAVTFPVIVDYKEQVVVRAGASGFIEQILVQPGQPVEPDQPIILLQNKQLLADLETAKIELESEQLKARIVKSEHEIATLQMHLEQIETLQTRTNELAGLVNELVVRAPTSGRVSSVNLESLLGMYVTPGMELLRVGSNHDLKIVGLVDQEQAKWLATRNDSVATTRIWGERSGVFNCRLATIPPRASQTVNRPAFAANNGGPIPVSQTLNGETETDSEQLSRSSESVTGLRFIKPHVEVVLDPAEKNGVVRRPGQMGLAKIRARGETLGSYLKSKLIRWFCQISDY